MNDLLKRHSSKSDPSDKSASLQKKIAVDSMLTELARPNVGTAEDRVPSKGFKPPFAQKQNPEDEVPVKSDPVTASVDLLTGVVDGHDRVIPPGAHDVNVRSKSTKNEMEAEKRKDEDTFGLTSAKHSYDFSADRSKRIATKIASNSFFKQFVSSKNVKVDQNSLIINIPRGKVTLGQFGFHTAAKMEKEISQTLRVRAKFAHLILSSGFDGISLEFLLV